MKSILFIDHEPIARNVFRWELAGRYHILEATSPVEALDICRNHREIDLLVCDTELGLVSGMELASLLRAWNSSLRIILTTDLSCECWTERQNAELLELPPDDVFILERPFSARDLKAAIKKLVPEEIAVARAI
ncbi:MAG TPA: response regulator [Bryobacteraceae bacterium]|jgi:CheY-like chemotaxis protein